MIKKMIIVLFVGFLLSSCTTENEVRPDSNLDYEISGMNDFYYPNEDYQLSFKVMNSYYLPDVEQIKSKMLFSGFDDNILDMTREKEIQITPLKDEYDYTETYFDINLKPNLPENADDSKQILRTHLLVDMNTEFSIPLCLVGIDENRDEADCSFSLSETDLNLPIEVIDSKYSFSPSTQTIILYFKADKKYDYFDVSSYDDFSLDVLSNLPKIDYTIENSYTGKIENSFRIDENNIGRLVLSIPRSEISGSFDSTFNVNLNYGLVNSKKFELNIKKS
ncbi:MAG: hypothetical protein ACOCRX_01205 [Candidatus Woesearchaeota archaeon]